MQTKYRGYQIAADTVQTRFGTLHRAWVNNGEPITDLPAFSTQQEAIDSAKRTVDFWES